MNRGSTPAAVRRSYSLSNRPLQSSNPRMPSGSHSASEFATVSIKLSSRAFPNRVLFRRDAAMKTPATVRMKSQRLTSVSRKNGNLSRSGTNMLVALIAAAVTSVAACFRKGSSLGLNNLPRIPTCLSISSWPTFSLGGRPAAKPTGNREAQLLGGPLEAMVRPRRQFSAQTTRHRASPRHQREHAPAQVFTRVSGVAFGFRG